MNNTHAPFESPVRLSKKAIWSTGFVIGVFATTVGYAQTASLTGNIDADQMVKQMGVAAACALMTNMAGGAEGAMSGVAQGAMSAFCGLPMNAGNMMTGGAQSTGVAMGAVNMSGIGTGVGMMPMGNIGMAGMMGGINPAMMAGQLSPEQMLGQMAGAMIGSAITGGLQNTMGGTTAGMMNGGGMGGNLNTMMPQVMGAAIGTALQSALSGTSGGNTTTNAYTAGTSVAGLSVMNGTVPTVYGPAYSTGFRNATGQNLTLSPQHGIRVGAPLVLQTYNVNGQTYVDTRPLNDAMNSGVRLANGDAAPEGGMRLGAFSGEIEDGIIQTVATNMASDVNPTSAAYRQGFDDGLVGHTDANLIETDTNYKAGHAEGRKHANNVV